RSTLAVCISGPAVGRCTRHPTGGTAGHPSCATCPRCCRWKSRRCRDPGRPAEKSPDTGRRRPRGRTRGRGHRDTAFGARWGGGGCGCGCASVLVVLTLGLVLTVFNAGMRIGVSVRIPLTDSNLTIAGSVGKKEKAADALPNYVRGKLGGNQNFINQSNTLTI